MCGICGAAAARGAVDRDALERMTAALRHRGPDDDGYHVVSDGDRGASCGLGFRRLSIIDVDGGHQPLPNEDETVWAICNGELYNFADLRGELEARGHRFRTGSDCEVLVHLYEEHGTGLVERLNGMFAFAIWDERDRSLLLVRDRLGKKPLYYADLGDELLFASEPKALLEHPACPRELDRGALSQYLAFEYLPRGESIFRGIRKLPGGHLLTWRGGRCSVECYWQVPAGTHDGGRAEDDVAREIRDRLRESVRLRLVSDVPLGVFLSGGVDSSSVVATMAQLVEPRQIQTFSMGFAERSFDESSYARRAAAAFGTTHHEEVLTPHTLVEILPEVVDFLDEPFADASVIPTYLLSKFTRRSVKVALGGDGADELFAGYPTFVAHRLASWYRVPRPVHERVVAPLVERLPVSTDNFSFDFKAKRFVRGVAQPAPLRDQLWLGSFSPAEQRSLLVDGADVDPYAELLRDAGRFANGSELELLVRLYLRYYLEGDILVKVDRASMAASLEVRAPFLDYTLVEFVSQLPPRLKLRGLGTKRLLKRAMAPLLPREIVNRRKKGFGIPVAQWLKHDLRWLLEDLLSPDRLRRQGIFDPRTVERLVADHISGRRDNRKQLWTLLVFQLWHDRWLTPSAASSRVAGGVGATRQRSSAYRR